MKTNTPQPETSPQEKSEAQNQASVGAILQAYKQQIAPPEPPEEEEAVQRKANTTGLPDNLKNGIENLSGYSLDDVNVHYNSSEPATLQAHAYAQGTDIHVAPGQEQHLPHEAWHVVQQKQGRVQPTRQLKGKTAINDDAGLEKEADVMGAKALQMKAPANALPLQHGQTANGAAQLATTIRYGGLTPFRFASGQVDVTNNVGTRMEAHLDPRDYQTGTDTSGSDAFNGLFDALQANTATTWVRGHLLNHDLGGIAHYNNLFPISTAANGEHYHEVEKLVKHWIGKKCEVDYNVVAAKTGGIDTPEGTFTCTAAVTNDPTPAGTYTGKQINKTIHSKITKTADNRQFADGSTTATNKFSSVVHNGGNNTFRDTYKGTLAKDTRWDHAGGSAHVNNQAVADAFAVAAAAVPAPAPASADQLNAVDVDAAEDREIGDFREEFEFTDYTEALLNGDLPGLYAEFLGIMTEEYQDENEPLFRYALEKAEDFDEFMLIYDDIMRTIQEPDEEEADSVAMELAAEDQNQTP